MDKDKLLAKYEEFVEFITTEIIIDSPFEEDAKKYKRLLRQIARLKAEVESEKPKVKPKTTLDNPDFFHKHITDEITDSDIEAWAEPYKYKSNHIWDEKSLIEGAKAMRDNEIKHIENGK